MERMEIGAGELSEVEATSACYARLVAAAETELEAAEEGAVAFGQASRAARDNLERYQNPHHGAVSLLIPSSSSSCSFFLPLLRLQPSCCSSG